MVTPLLAPIAGVPALVTSVSGFESAITEILHGSGPIAIDAERASGYRYSQRAYLIQIKRTGGGLHLLDPIAIGPTHLWKELSDQLSDQEWIIHASTQDLPCLRELGVEPKILFDTELGGRIAGCERVGLGPLAESLLEISLAKEHSAVDWSLRPLRAEWLNYAALDVEILIELRDAVAIKLLEQGKLHWALEDFNSIIHAPLAAAKKDPWRRTSGMHKIRDRQTLAIIRELWIARDEYAKRIDLSPGRVFNDEALIEIATKRPKSVTDLAKIVARRSRVENPPVEKWHQILTDVLTWTNDRFPELRTPSTGLPPIKMWRDKNPLAFARLSHARAAVLEISEDLAIPAENLISPEFVRRLCWSDPVATDPVMLAAEVKHHLLELGARSWQVEQLLEALVVAVQQTVPLPPKADEELEATAEEV